MWNRRFARPGGLTETSHRGRSSCRFAAGWTAGLGEGRRGPGRAEQRRIRRYGRGHWPTTPPSWQPTRRPDRRSRRKVSGLSGRGITISTTWGSPAHPAVGRGGAAGGSRIPAPRRRVADELVPINNRWPDRRGAGCLGYADRTHRRCHRIRAHPRRQRSTVAPTAWRHCCGDAGARQSSIPLEPGAGVRKWTASDGDVESRIRSQARGRRHRCDGARHPGWRSTALGPTLAASPSLIRGHPRRKATTSPLLATARPGPGDPSPATSCQLPAGSGTWSVVSLRLRPTATLPSPSSPPVMKTMSVLDRCVTSVRASRSAWAGIAEIDHGPIEGVGVPAELGELFGPVRKRQPPPRRHRPLAHYFTRCKALLVAHRW